jgi:hypothetical protein
VNSLLQTTTANRGVSQRAGIRPPWLASAAWVIASIACATVAMANVPVGEWSPAYSEAAAPDELPVKPAPLLVTHGVVEIIRKFEASGAVPAGYEFTVRLRDGSTRVSSDASAASWRVGDSIMLIGGDTRTAKSPVSL